MKSAKHNNEPKKLSKKEEALQNENKTDLGRGSDRANDNVRQRDIPPSSLPLK